MERMVESVYCIVVCRVTLAGLKGDVNFRVQQIDCCGWFHMIPLDQGHISGFLSLSEMWPVGDGLIRVLAATRCECLGVLPSL